MKQLSLNTVCCQMCIEDRSIVAEKDVARSAQIAVYEAQMTEIWQKNNTHTLYIKEKKMYELKEKI